MPTDHELAELTTDATVALFDLELLAATVRELVERAEADRLTTGMRLELLPDAIARVAAVQRFLLELAPQQLVDELVAEAVEL